MRDWSKNQKSNQYNPSHQQTEKEKIIYSHRQVQRKTKGIWQIQYLDVIKTLSKLEEGNFLNFIKNICKPYS